MRTIGWTPTKDNTPEPETVKTEYGDMDKSQLIALCEEKGIELTASDKRSKKQLISILENVPEEN